MPCCCCGKSTPPYVNWCASCYAEWDQFQLLDYCTCGKPIHNPNKFFLENGVLSARCDDCSQKLAEDHEDMSLEDVASFSQDVDMDDFNDWLEEL